MLYTFIKYLLRNQIIFVLVVVISLWFIVQIKDIIVSIFLSYIIMAAVLPSVEFLKKKKFPKTLAVLIPYFGIICAIFLLIIPLIPFIAGQIQSLLTKLPQFLSHSKTIFGVTFNQSQLEKYINDGFGTIGQSAVDITTKVFGGFFSLITIFVVSFYLLMYNDGFKKLMADLFHDGSREHIYKILDKVNEKLGAWLRGQVILMIFIGTFSWIGLTILGLPFALPLALLAGLLEIVPTLGPILSGIPAVIVGLTVSPTMALTVIVLYLLIQALESQFLVPKVMQQAVGLNPVLVILSIMIGTNLMGIAGTFLAIPFVSFIVVVINSLETTPEK